MNALITDKNKPFYASLICLFLFVIIIPKSNAEHDSHQTTNAQPNTLANTKPIEILFIGDSLTHGKIQPILSYNNCKVVDLNYNLPSSSPRYERHASEPGPWGGIPGIFAKFCEEAGLNYRTSIEAISSRSLDFHAKAAKDGSEPLILQSKWDVIVMQELSRNPLPNDRKGNKEKFLNAANYFINEFHQLNPAIKIYLYQTWPMANQIYMEGGSYHNFTDPCLALKTMTEHLYNGYKEAIKFSNCTSCTVIPVGNAWFELINSGFAVPNPYHFDPLKNQVNLWQEDGKHPSVYGAYFSALVIFATITHYDPRLLGYEQVAKNLSISCDRALKLEEFAYQITRNLD